MQELCNKEFEFISIPLSVNISEEIQIKKRKNLIEKLTVTERLILNKSCHYSSKKSLLKINPDEAFSNGSHLNLSPVDIRKCILALEKKEYITVFWFAGGIYYGCSYSITKKGFDIYQKSYIKDYG